MRSSSQGLDPLPKPPCILALPPVCPTPDRNVQRSFETQILETGVPWLQRLDSVWICAMSQPTTQNRLKKTFQLPQHLKLGLLAVARSPPSNVAWGKTSKGIAAPPTRQRKPYDFGEKSRWNSMTNCLRAIAGPCRYPWRVGVWKNTIERKSSHWAIAQRWEDGGKGCWISYLTHFEDKNIFWPSAKSAVLKAFACWWKNMFLQFYVRKNGILKSCG